MERKNFMRDIHPAPGEFTARQLEAKDCAVRTLVP